MIREQVLNLLRVNGVCHEVFFHKSFYSCSDNDLNLPGIDVKCLLLEESPQGPFYLVVLRCNDRLDFAKLRQLIGSKKIEFASAENCERLLCCKPGSVSVLGILLTGAKVKVIFEKSLVGQTVQIHPCDNTATVTLEFDAMYDLLKSCGVDVEVNSLAKPL